MRERGLRLVVLLCLGLSRYCGSSSQHTYYYIGGSSVEKVSCSHHLSCLKEAGLVDDEREGKYIYYQLNTSVVEEIWRWAAGLGKG